MTKKSVESDESLAKQLEAVARVHKAQEKLSLAKSELAQLQADVARLAGAGRMVCW